MTENITLFTQNSIRIKTPGKTVYIDPFRMREEPHDADIIFITHDHHDHYSPEDIAMVAGKDTVIVLPEKMAGTDTGMRTVTVKAGESGEINGLAFEAVPAYNNLKPFHMKNAGWVGYILSVDGRRIYVAGDTDLNEDNKKIKCDIALVPIGGKFTMDAKEAARLINIIKPETVIPTHYGGIVGSEADAEKFASLVEPPIKVEIKKLY